MLPDYRRQRECGWDWRRRDCGCGRFRGFRPAAGLCCILLAVLILLVCAPEWLVSLIVACLLLAVGFWCLMRR